jgi:hypothetical protein
MADNTCKKRRGKKDAALAARNTAKNKDRRAQTRARRETRKHVRLMEWARRNGIVFPSGTARAIRRAVRNRRRGVA